MIDLLYGGGRSPRPPEPTKERHIMSIRELEELAELVEVQAEFQALNEQADAEQAVRKYAA